MFLNCKALTKADTERSFKKISTKDLIKNILEEQVSYNSLFIRSKVTITEKGSSNQINLSIRIKNNDKILVSGSLLIPLFKALITEKEIAFYEKIKKTYYIEDYNTLTSIINFKLSLNSLEKLFVGMPMGDFKGARFSQLTNIENYILESNNKKVQATYIFNPFTYKLTEQKLYSSLTNSELTIQYSNYKTIDGKNFPQKIIIIAKGKKRNLKILLNLNSNRIDEELSFPFEIPKDYKKTEL